MAGPDLGCWTRRTPSELGSGLSVIMPPAAIAVLSIDISSVTFLKIGVIQKG